MIGQGLDGVFEKGRVHQIRVRQIRDGILHEGIFNLAGGVDGDVSGGRRGGEEGVNGRRRSTFLVQSKEVK